MQESMIKTSGHDWEKKNLVTLSRGGKMFDDMVCRNCGMRGRRYGLVSVEVSGSYKAANVRHCPNAQDPIPKRIKVTLCQAQGRAFSNLTPGSEHDVVTPPEGYKKMTGLAFGLWAWASQLNYCHRNTTRWWDDKSINNGSYAD